MATFKDRDDEIWKKCPYNATHRIAPRSYLKHLRVCPTKNNVNYRVCPFNASHRIEKDKYEQHMDECRDNFNLIRNMYEESRLIKKTGNSFIYKNLNKKSINLVNSSKSLDEQNDQFYDENILKNKSCSSNLTEISENSDLLNNTIDSKLKHELTDDWNSSEENSFRLIDVEEIRLSNVLNDIQLKRELPTPYILENLNKSERRLCYQLFVDVTRNQLDKEPFDDNISLSSYSSLDSSSNKTLSSDDDIVDNSISSCSLAMSDLTINNYDDDDYDDIYISKSKNNVACSNFNIPCLEMNKEINYVRSNSCNAKFNIENEIIYNNDMKKNDDIDDDDDDDYKINNDGSRVLSSCSMAKLKQYNDSISETDDEKDNNSECNASSVYKPLRRPKSSVFIGKTQYSLTIDYV